MLKLGDKETVDRAGRSGFGKNVLANRKRKAGFDVALFVYLSEVVTGKINDNQRIALIKSL